ncbi:hypothetical protein RIR_jg7783.t1 [Rhizophagus irregularis DAOM 181602=DAOM 197198]|nr:hypothetical protein RIR_jg7783.t1 [Rhizophagus irregularis DAOM 181602=DAOM 197198]
MMEKKEKKICVLKLFNCTQLTYLISRFIQGVHYKVTYIMSNYGKDRMAEEISTTLNDAEDEIDDYEEKVVVQPSTDDNADLKN